MSLAEAPDPDWRHSCTTRTRSPPEYLERLKILDAQHEEIVLRRLLKQALKFAGLEVRRVPSPSIKKNIEQYIQLEKVSDGHIIEFVGLPGVGKTFLMNRCAERLQAFYITQKELLKSELRSLFEAPKDSDILSLYKELLDIQIMSVLSEMPNDDNFSRRCLGINALSRRLLSNLPIENAFPVRILTDEGIVKLFTNTLLQLAEAGNEGARKALARRSLVLLSAEPQLAATQFAARHKKKCGGRSKFYRGNYLDGLAHTDLIRYYAEKDITYSACVEKLALYSKKTIKLSRQDDLEHNVRTVLALAK